MDGRQAALAGTLGGLQTDVAAHGESLEGIGKTCTQLLQVGAGCLVCGAP